MLADLNYVANQKRESNLTFNLNLCKNGVTALMHATVGGHVETVRILLHHQAEVSIANKVI